MKKFFRVFYFLITASFFHFGVEAQMLYVPGGTGAIGNNAVNGNVGIGTGSSAPISLFTIRNSSLADNSTTGNIDMTFATTLSGFGNKISTFKETFNTAGMAFFTQYGYASPYERMRISAYGNVGIGTTNPYQQLSITGGIGFANQNSIDKKLFSPVDGILEWFTHDYAGEHGFTVSHQGERRVYLNTSGNSYFTGGNLLIGKTSQTSSGTRYRLDVEGPIRAHEIVVNTTGADFVFEPSYKLLPLSELETFIKTNKHLPDIAPAKEMQENGVSSGEMHAKLLQKVEELTLYLIEQQKVIEQQNLRIKQLESK